MRTEFPFTDKELYRHIEKAVLSYWSARSGQATRQLENGASDAGTRGEVTGGAHLDAFCDLLCDLINRAGFSKQEIRFRTGVELPGFYRPTKKWDIVVIRRGRLCAAIEMKSQVGPSFGNNFNNRTEEAIGNAVDIWRSFKEGILGIHPPWLGYFFFLEHALRSTSPVGVADTPFGYDPIFKKTSYAERYGILCRRLVLERHYNAACLLLSPRALDGSFVEPSIEVGFSQFARGLYGHLIGCV